MRASSLAAGPCPAQAQGLAGTIPGMNRTSSLRSVLRPLALVAALSVATTAVHAESGSGSSNALRFAAVGGTLSSWAYAAWKGAPFTDCRGAQWQARSQIARDKELDLVSVGGAYGECQMLSVGDWNLSHQTSVSLGRWDTRGAVSGAQSAWDLAVVPLVHWQHAAFEGHKLELEFGVGPALLTEPHIGNRYKSTQYQFSDHLGVNLVDGSGKWRVGLAWRHISNLDIQTPNNGVDFKGVTVAFRL